MSLLLFLALICGGPTARIVGPAAAAEGDLVVLDASTSEGKSFAWALPGSTKSFLPVDGGQKCVFSSGKAGTFVFVLAVGGGDGVSLATHTIRIGDGEPPAPGPDKPPAPKPPPADTLKDWVSATAAKTVAAEALERRRAAIAAAFGQLAAGLKAGSIKSTADLRAKTREAVDAAADGDGSAWLPFRIELANRLEAISKTGAPADTDLPGWAAVWESIAAGLQKN